LEEHAAVILALVEERPDATYEEMLAGGALRPWHDLAETQCGRQAAKTPAAANLPSGKCRREP
jgi:hypothetical protein